MIRIFDVRLEGLSKSGNSHFQVTFQLFWKLANNIATLTATNRVFRLGEQMVPLRQKPYQQGATDEEIPDTFNGCAYLELVARPM